MSNNEFRDLVDNGVWALQKSLKLFLDKYKDMEDSTDRTALSVEERSQLVLLYQAQDKIWNAYQLLDRINKPVVAQGQLTKNANGRYEVNGVELTAGEYIEYYEAEDGGCYLPSRVEHSGEDYYIVALGRDKSIQGLQVRIK